MGRGFQSVLLRWSTRRHRARLRLGALRKLEAARGPAVPSARLPVVLFGHKLLAMLPYKNAHWVWVVLNVAALGSLFFWPGIQRWFIWPALAWSAAASVVLRFGQDVPLFLCFFTLGLLMLGRGRPRLAGALFSLCLCKYHLAVGIPVMLIARKQWKAAIAFAAACAAWIVACFLIEGSRWPIKYAKLFSMPELSPGTANMPNLHGLSSWAPGSAILEILLCAAVLALLWDYCRRSKDIGLTGAMAAACGLILGRHGYVGDCLLLIPLAVLILQRHMNPFWLRAWGLLILSPAPIVTLTVIQPLLGQLLVVGFVPAAMLVQLWQQRAPRTVLVAPASQPELA